MYFFVINNTQIALMLFVSEQNKWPQGYGRYMPRKQMFEYGNK